MFPGYAHAAGFLQKGNIVITLKLFGAGCDDSVEWE
jgi:hypothetical protein